MEDRKFVQPLLLVIVFIIMGAAFAGMTTPSESYIQIQEDCANYSDDADGDGDMGFIEDSDCHDFPYSSGKGEIGQNNAGAGQAGTYQPFFDLTVDFVRGFVQIECGGSLNNCIGTNFDTETKFYCWFEQNVMFEDFLSMFDEFFNVNQILPDDGSLAAYFQTCPNFPNQPPATFPLIEYQSTSPLPVNSGGSGGGK